MTSHTSYYAAIYLAQYYITVLFRGKKKNVNFKKCVAECAMAELINNSRLSCTYNNRGACWAWKM